MTTESVAPVEVSSTTTDIPATVRRLRQTFATGRTRSVEWRKGQLRALERLMTENETAIADALDKDLGRSPFEAWLADVASPAGEAAFAAKNVGKWMKRRHRLLEMSQLPGRGWVEHEPYGTVLIIGAWNFPFALTLGPAVGAIAAGNTVVLKPSEVAPASAALMAELVPRYLDKDAIAVIEGDGAVSQELIAQGFDHLLFTGGTEIGRKVYEGAAAHLTPVTLELGGKSPNIFFNDVMAAADNYQDKALEGFTMFALNQGEVCTCPSRSLIQADIYDEFLALAAIRTKAVRQGDPLDTETMIGAQASNDQLEKILSYIEIGKSEGAQVVTGGERAQLGGELNGGYYVAPTIFTGNNKMRVFQEEIFGPVVAVTSFTDYDDAISIANDTLYGLGAGVWSRDGNTAYRAGRDIKAGRVWTNCYHQYPAHAAFGGYKQSGIGRENHKMMLDHYQQTKNLLVSYSDQALGFF